MTSNVSNDIKRARQAMQAGAFNTAKTILDSILERTPEHKDALYMAAVCARYDEQFDAAAEHLAQLKHLAPEYGRAFQEEGHLHLAQSKPDAAYSAFRLATQYNPALTASWEAMAKIDTNAGRTEAANLAHGQLERMKALPRELFAVTNHLYEGRIVRAETLARAFLQKNPQHIEGMRLLAEIGTRLGVHEDAEFLLESAIALDSANIQLRLDYIQVLRKRQKFALALREAKALHSRAPDNPIFQSLLAIESLQTGDYETAIGLFDKVLEVRPNDPATLTSRGHALKTYGRTDDAIASYRAAISDTPEHGEGWYALANLKTYTFSDAEMQDMLNASARPDLGFMARVHLAFALGKAFEDRGNYDRAFENYHMGNRLKAEQSRYTSGQMQTEFDVQKDICIANLFAKHAGEGHDAPDPIFIVGLPRAGSTLIEQILASHSQVDGTLELPNILSLAHNLAGRDRLTQRDRYPRILHELSADELIKMGEEYISQTQIHRKSAPYFTDKMPNNFRHLGLIHLILPKAKIIDARRDPMDCCWSAYKQLFAEGQEFTYGMEEIGHYYRGYTDLMAHWDSVLPEGRILRVMHEDVLDDLEGQVRRILNYCGLEFEQACVDFHKTDRAVRTASSEQVRTKINRAGQGRWRPFKAHLEPLKSALENKNEHQKKGHTT